MLMVKQMQDDDCSSADWCYSVVSKHALLADRYTAREVQLTASGVLKH